MLLQGHFLRYISWDKVAQNNFAKKKKKIWEPLPIIATLLRFTMNN